MSQFLSQFLLNIYHKLGQLNIILNIFVRFSGNNTLTKTIDLKFNKLDTTYIYNIIFVEIDKSFAIKIYKGYNNNLA